MVSLCITLWVSEATGSFDQHGKLLSVTMTQTNWYEEQENYTCPQGPGIPPVQ